MENSNDTTSILLCPASSSLLWQPVYIWAWHGTAARFRRCGRTGYSDKTVPDWSLKWGLCSVFVLCSASEGQRGPWFLEFVAEILCHLFFFHSYVTWIVGSSPMWHDILLLLLFGYYSSIYLLPCGNIYFGECVLLPTWGCSDSCLVLGSYCLECSNMLVFCPYPFASFLTLRRSLAIFKDYFCIMQ